MCSLLYVLLLIFSEWWRMVPGFSPELLCALPPVVSEVPVALGHVLRFYSESCKAVVFFIWQKTICVLLFTQYLGDLELAFQIH